MEQIAQIFIAFVIIKVKLFFCLKLIKIIDLEYTPLNWVTPSFGEVNDPKDNLTFLFSLNKIQKFTKILERAQIL